MTDHNCCGHPCHTSEDRHYIRNIEHFHCCCGGGEGTPAPGPTPGPQPDCDGIHVGGRVDLYVSKEGSEEGDGTEENPFLRIQQAVDYAEQRLCGNHSVYIWVDDGIYEENVSVLHLRSIRIQGLNEDKSKVIVRGTNPEESYYVVLLKDCAHAEVRHLTIEGLSINGNLKYQNCGAGNAYNVQINGKTDRFGIFYQYASGYLQDCVINNSNWAINVGYAGVVHSRNSTGSGNKIGISSHGSIVFLEGSVPSATTAQQKTAGGQIYS